MINFKQRREKDQVNERNFIPGLKLEVPLPKSKGLGAESEVNGVVASACQSGEPCSQVLYSYCEDGLSVFVFKAVGKASSASGFGLNVGM